MTCEENAKSVKQGVKWGPTLCPTHPHPPPSTPHSLIASIQHFGVKPFIRIWILQHEKPAENSALSLLVFGHVSFPLMLPAFRTMAMRYLSTRKVIIWYQTLWNAPPPCVNAFAFYFNDVADVDFIKNSFPLFFPPSRRHKLTGVANNSSVLWPCEHVAQLVFLAGCYFVDTN